MRKHILLAEMLRLQNVILEDRMEGLRKVLLPRIEKQIDKIHVPDNMEADLLAADGETRPEQMLNFIASFDPDPTKKNTQWLANLVLSNAMPVEDLYQATTYLKRFAVIRNRLPAKQRDLNLYKTLPDLWDVLSPFEDKEIVSKRQEDRDLEQKMLAQAKVIYNSPDYRIVVPKTEQASCYFGINTKWCTAATQTRNHFNSYNNRGPLYIILQKKTNTRWQFHPATHEFMDEANRPIDVQKFLDAHPVVADVFNKMEEATGDELIGQVKAKSGNIFVWLSKDDTVETKMHMTFKMGRGVMARQFLTLSGECKGKGHPFEVFSSRWSSYIVDFDAADMAKLLNRHHVTVFSTEDNLHPIQFGEFNKKGLFYNKSKWGTIDAVGEVVLKVGGYTWHTADEYYGLSDLHLIFTLFDGSEGLEIPDFDDPSTNKGIIERGERLHEIEQCIAELMIKLHQHVDNENGLRDNQFSRDIIKYIADHDKSLLSFSALVQIIKDPEELIPQIREELDAMGVEWTHKIEKIGGEYYVIEKTYSDAYAAAEDNAEDTSNMDYYIGILNGDRFVDSYGTPDDPTNIERLEELSADDLKRVGDYMQSTYPDEADEIEDYDPTDASKIYELQQLADDESLNGAFLSSYRSGEESGIESEISNAFKSMIEHCSYLIPKTDDVFGEYYKAIPLDAVARVLSDSGERHNWEYEGTFQHEDKLSINEPSYGFSDFDEEVAKERFKEEIRDFLPDNS